MNKIIYLLMTALLLMTAGTSLADTLQNELVYRASLGRADDVKLLLEQGASANQTNDDGVPIISLASARKDAEGQNVVKALIDAGANVNATDKNGQTALFYAAREGNKDTVNMLLNNNINYYAIDNHGDIARTLAFKNGHQDIVDTMDGFVKGETQKVQQQYEDVNNELKERYQKEQEDEQKAVDEQKKLDEAANPALDNGAATPTNTKSAISAEDEIAAKRESPAFKQGMHDYAFQNCAFQYWYYVQQAKQSTELSPDELDIATSSHKDAIEQQSKQMIDTYQLDQKYMDNVSANAKQRIFYDLTMMSSNTERHEEGVGKMDDMKDRCEHIANSWTEQATALPSKKDRNEKNDEAAGGGKGNHAAGVKQQKQQRQGKTRSNGSGNSKSHMNQTQPFSINSSNSSANFKNFVTKKGGNNNSFSPFPSAYPQQ